MEKSQPKVVGLDIGRGECTACPLEELPKDLLRFTRAYKPLKLLAITEDIDTLAELGDWFVMEPTGADYHLWMEELQNRGKVVLLATGTRIRNLARQHGILNKTDKDDAAVIAYYGLLALSSGQQSAFIEPPSGQIRERYLALKGLKRHKTDLSNMLRARLVRENPVLACAKDTKRQWTCTTPGSLWRKIGGEPVRGYSSAEDDPGVGRGLSDTSRAIGRLVCDIERIQAGLETELDELLGERAFDRYRKIFGLWAIAPLTQSAILSSIYPFERFLGPDGGRIRERVPATGASKHSSTSRDRSMKSFQRAIGCGQKIVQSGKSEFRVMTGDPQIRAAIYSWLETLVLINREPTPRMLLKAGKPDGWEDLGKRKQKDWLKAQSVESQLPEWIQGAGNPKEPWNCPVLLSRVAAYNQINERVVGLQIYYLTSPTCQNLKKDERMMKIFSRFCRLLYKDLLREWTT
jgi:hypothetical protein